MNRTTPYEDLMAAKLDQIPVPDMSDSIWASIEMQLDEVPPAPGNKSSGSNAGHAWYGVITLAVTVTLCWWFYSHKKPLPKIEIVPPTKTEVKMAPRDSAVVIKTISKPLPVILKADTIKAMINIEAVPEKEEEQKEIPVPVDSAALIHEKTAPVEIDTPVKKKPKGVKGITKDDYRLSVKKDSIK